ncbi:hypothetical protein GF378_02385, partial [Candidatus Pacearchaeota archaeon]|nr:hypothetical protein [Candidatus Pacearchaeota archaeon]
MKFKRGKRINNLLTVSFMCVIFVVLSISFVSAIRITPAKIEGAFRPGFETEVTYRVSSPTGKNIEVFVNGGLADYITLDKEKIKGSGEVIASIKFPEDLELEPGTHKTYVGARE